MVILYLRVQTNIQGALSHVPSVVDPFCYVIYRWISGLTVGQGPDRWSWRKKRAGNRGNKDNVSFC